DVRCPAVALVEAVPRVVEKTYRYTLDLSPAGDPFLAGLAWRVRVDPARLVPLADLLVGEHDFRAFRRRGETRADLRRRVLRAAWRMGEGRADFDVTGDGFPY